MGKVIGAVEVPMTDGDVQGNIADCDINRVQHREEQNSKVLRIRKSGQLERPAHIEEHAPQTPAGRMYTRQQVWEWELGLAVSSSSYKSLRGGGFAGIPSP